MDRNIWKMSLMVLMFCLILVSVTVSSSAASLNQRLSNKNNDEKLPEIPEAKNQFLSYKTRVINGSQKLYLPFVVVSEAIPTIELLDAWTEDLSGNVATKYASDDIVSYFASGVNSDDNANQVSLRWEQDGPCGATTVYSDTVGLASGEWQHTFTSTIPSCNGVYTNTVYIKENGFESTLSTHYEVKPTSSVVIGTGQAFDRCILPSLELMQNWWDNSPYSVFNIYLGGVSFACSQAPDDLWISSASLQGWAFIPLWVGPQAPCTDCYFKYKMSRNPVISYLEGRAEADAAFLSAHSLGFIGEKIIYYDLEGYPDEAGNREAVKSFVRGWVERLHELGVKAGVYGSPCRSYIADWNSISPKPDNIWIAHWYTDRYDPNARVFDTPCLSDILWSNHQRIKQYSQPHSEKWGGYQITIDSNVLDGEIYQFPPVLPSRNSVKVAQPVVAYSSIRDMALVSENTGWVLVDQNLYWTDDFGTQWRDITPLSRGGGKILAVQFVDDHLGWLLKQDTRPGGDVELGLLMTNDAGSSWQEMTNKVIDDNNFHVGSASLEFIDDQTGWISIKEQSSSNFSLGRLFATQDGGRSWDERTTPIGEPVRFINSNDGWIAGGPAGDQLYRTVDGGVTWQTVNYQLSGISSDERVFVDLPQFDNKRTGYLPITVADGPDSRFEVLISYDGGNSWKIDNKVELNLDVEPALKLPFRVNNLGNWWAASPVEEKIYISAAIDSQGGSLIAMGTPPGTVSIDLVSDKYGWALVQEGTCRGYKIPVGGSYEAGQEPLSCTQVSRIFATQDGGMSWYGISPSN